MKPAASIPDLVRLSLVDPVSGGRALLALNPPMAVRWMLLAAALSASVVLLYALPAAIGGLEELPSPFGFVGMQGAMNLLLVLLITGVGRSLGGQGGFDGALWLVGWMQAITTMLLVPQIAALLLVPAASVPVAVFSIGMTLWILVGFICALHGFASRFLVLLGMIGTFLAFSAVLSMVLVALGVDPTGIGNV